MKKNERSAFEKAAAAPARNGFVSDLWYFLKTNKKWWLIPILALFLLLGLLVLLSSTGLAPFIYTLF
jgi:Family of unknown function (DUF5989)